MVDEARDVAADAGVNYRAVGELETPDVAAANVSALARQALLARNLLACVVDDPCVLRNRARRVDATSMNRRPPLFDHAFKSNPGIECRSQGASSCASSQCSRSPSRR